MTRFYFHIHDGHEPSQDLEGTELADLSAAREEAILAIREIMAEQLMRGESMGAHSIEIRNEAGRLLETVTLQDAVHKILSS